MMQTRGVENVILSVQMDPRISIDKITNAFFHLREYDRPGYLLIRYHGWCPPRRGKVSLDWWKKLAMVGVRKVVEQNGPFDLVHAHTYWAQYLASEIDREYGIPFITTEHSAIHLPGILRTFHRQLIPGAAQGAKILHCASRGMQTGLKEVYRRDFELLPLPVDTVFFSKGLKKRKFTNSDFPVFLSIGAPWKTKGFDTLILAFSMVKKQSLPGAVLRIGDKIPGREKLDSLAADLGVKDSVEWLGPLTKYGVRNAFEGADIYVSASRYESFNRTIPEAMAAGLPVISTQTYGPVDYLKPFCGLLVSADNPPAMADAMTEMARNTNRYNRKKISDYVSENFSTGVLSNEFFNMYTRALC